MAELDSADPIAVTTGIPFVPDPTFRPVWARSRVQYAQNLLECSNEPIEYSDSDEDNCFFFPEDCVYRPKARLAETSLHATAHNSNDDIIDTMNPVLPNIKMLDPSALSALLTDNLSPPEITSIVIFATNGAIFAHASPMPQRLIRNLTATYAAAYASYAVSSSGGNLTGVTPTTHPSSYITAPSVPLGNIGSIIFELEDQDQVAVVTKVADKVLLAVVGPTRVDARSRARSASRQQQSLPRSAASDLTRATTTAPESLSSTLDHQSSSTADASGKFASSAPNPGCYLSKRTERNASLSSSQDDADEALRAQWEIDRRADLERLASLNLVSSPPILLALESKSAALGRFLGNKLADLENPEDS